MIETIGGLTPEEKEEKSELFKTGFTKWTLRDF